VPVRWLLVRTPRVSRHLATAPQENTIYTATHIRFLSDPPRQRHSARELQLGKLDSRVQTRSCRIGKVRPCAHVLNESTSANLRSRGGYLFGEVRVIIDTRHASSFPNPPSTHTNTLQPLYATPACRSKVLHGVQGLDQGRGRGGENATKCTVRIVVMIVHLPKSTPPCGLRVSAVTGSCPGPRWRVKIEEERGEDAGL
jgi:hypothetical protein